MRPRRRWAAAGAGAYIHGGACARVAQEALKRSVGGVAGWSKARCDALVIAGYITVSYHILPYLTVSYRTRTLYRTCCTSDRCCILYLVTSGKHLMTAGHLFTIKASPLLTTSAYSSAYIVTCIQYSYGGVMSTASTSHPASLAFTPHRSAFHHQA